MNEHNSIEKVKKPLSRMIFIGCGLFFVVLSVVLLGLAYRMTYSSLVERFNSKLEHVIIHVEHRTDADDLRSCIETGEKSQKYRQLQELLNCVVDDFELEYLYIVIPTDQTMVNVCSATSTAEREAGISDMELLENADGYSAEDRQMYLSCWDAEGVSFFEESSDYGAYYTACKPLRDSRGDAVALICADLPINAKRHYLHSVMAFNFAFITLVCGLGCVWLLRWLRKNVSEPIIKLEESARDYTENTHKTQDFVSLRFNTPDISTENEVQALSKTIETMTADTQMVARELIAANAKAQKAEEEARSAAKIAELKESVSCLLNNMPAMTFSKDAVTGQYLACNRAFADFNNLGAPENIVGHITEDIFDPDTARHFIENDRIAMSMDEPYVYFTDVKDAWGNMRHFQNRKLKFIDTSGRLCTLGMCVDVTDLVEAERESIRAKEAYEAARSEGMIYSRIAKSLAQGYANLYYVNLETLDFIEYRTGGETDDLTVERRGTDFFEACRRDLDYFIHPDDREKFVKFINREKLLDEVDRTGTMMMEYRLRVGDEYRYVNMRVSRMSDDEKHVIVGVTDIDAQIRERRAIEQAKEERVIYSRISALTGDYICIFTVDPVTEKYRQFVTTKEYESLSIAVEEDNFFEVARENSKKVVYPADLDRYLLLFTKENIMSEIERCGFFGMKYRLIFDGRTVYVYFKAAMIQENEGPVLVIGINDIDAQVRQEEEFQRKLAQAQSIANIDALTGVKNRHAFLDAEGRLDRQISDRDNPEFAIVILDVNDLKTVNDNEGHQAGDEYLRVASQVICQVFKQSPVFRVGGDEFAVIVTGSDYDCIEELMGRMRDHNSRAVRNGGIVIACGMSKFNGDDCVAAVFERADLMMYENKASLKGGGKAR